MLSSQIITFEIGFNLKGRLFQISSLILFVAGFLITSLDLDIIGDGNRYLINSPYRISSVLLVLNLLLLFPVSLLSGGAIVRGFETHSNQLLFTTGVSARGFFLNTFLGTMAAILILTLCTILGVLIGPFMPWVTGPVGTQGVEATIVGGLIYNIPFVGFVSAVTFALCASTRKRSMAYLFAALMAIMHILSRAFASPEMISFGAMIDPVGIVGMMEHTQYWSVSDRNALLPALAGPGLLNRLGLLVIAIAALISTANVNLAEPGKKWFRLPSWMKRELKPEPRASFSNLEALPADIVVHSVPLQSVLRICRTELSFIIKSPVLYILLLIAGLNVINDGVLNNLEVFLGTPSLPVTSLMIRVVDGSFLPIAMIILAFFTAVVTSRESRANMGDLTGTLPTSGAEFMLGKYFALVSILVITMLFAVGVASLIQVVSGVTAVEVGALLRGTLFYHLPEILYLPAIALFFGALIGNGYAGVIALIALLFLPGLFDSLGFEHNLYRISLPQLAYSDLAGFGAMAEARTWFGIYWTLFGAALLVLGSLLWVKGRERVVLVVSLLTQFGTGVKIFAVILLAWVGVGGFIYYNTNILNAYQDSNAINSRLARHEREYLHLADLPQPSVKEMDAFVDIHPDQRKVEVSGTFLLQNASGVPIDTIYFSIPLGFRVDHLLIDGQGPSEKDETLGIYTYKLSNPMQPGDSFGVDFSQTWQKVGFANAAEPELVASNGSMFSIWQAFPTVGYNEFGNRITNPRRRQEFGLAPYEGLPGRSYPDRYKHIFESTSFHLTVATAPDQIAVAPGALKRKWKVGERSYFEYETDAPIVNFFAVLSGKYKVLKDKWGEVDIEIYYDPKHAFNLGSMIKGAKDSLAFHAAKLGPYPHKVLRIVEHPGYSRSAQSYPSLIPFSETYGFIADLRDKSRFDYVYLITAHEVAHQYWGMQVFGAYTKGYRVITESLSEFSALMVMEKTYGREYMKQFLDYELTRYLRGRSRDAQGEVPLAKTGEQPYLYYRKGALALYALKEELGEDALFGDLNRFFNTYKGGINGLPTTIDLRGFLERGLSQDQRMKIKERFEEIVFYDFRITSAEAAEAEGGQYTVKLDIQARKSFLDDEGVMVDAEIFGSAPVTIFGSIDRQTGVRPILKTINVFLGPDPVSLEITVEGRPVYAEVDPFHQFLDPSPQNKRRRITIN